MPEFDYLKMIDDVIKREGVYVNHPADQGGPTNMGITQKTLTKNNTRCFPASP